MLKTSHITMWKMDIKNMWAVSRYGWGC
jgi:hypothetical protein